MAVAVFLTYLGSLDNAFQYDDIHSIVENPHIRSLADPWGFVTQAERFSADPRQAMYRPLVVLSYAVQYRLGRYDPIAYHAFNIGLHALNALLVYAVVCLLGGGRRWALAVAAIFALHPINSQAVNYVSARSESLCAMGMLIGLAAYLVARRQGGLDSAWWGLSLLGLALGLGSKAVAVALPGMLLIYEWARAARGLQPAAQYTLPHWGLAAAYVLGTRGGITQAVFAAPVRDLWTQALTQTKALAYYLKLLVVPVHLSVEHGLEAASGRGDAAVWAAAALLASLAVLALKHRRPALWLWGGLALLPLLPTLVVPLNILVNEHRLYLSSMAFGVLLAAICATMGRRGGIALVCWLLVTAGLAHQRSAVWQSPQALWTDAMEKSPQRPRPHIYRGQFLRQEGRVDEALQAYAHALKVNPAALTAGDVLTVYNNIGSIHLAAGRRRQAAAAYRAALAVDPAHRAAREALEALRALQEDVWDAEAERLYKRGSLQALVQGQTAEGIALLRRALDRQLRPEIYMALALAHERAADTTAALGAYRALAEIYRGTASGAAAGKKLRELAPKRSGGDAR